MKLGKGKATDESAVFSNTEEESAQEPKKKIEVKLTVTLLCILFAIALCIAVPLFSVPEPISIVLFLIAGLLSGTDILLSGVYSLMHEDYFNRNSLLMVVFVVSFIVGVAYEGALLLIITQVSLLLNDYITKRNNEQVIAMTGLEFETAKVYEQDTITEKYLDEIQPGDEIIVSAGEYVPLDCVVIDGQSTIDAKLIDGISREKEASAGTAIIAGTLNLTGDLHCEVTSNGSTTASDILNILWKEEPIVVPDIVRLFQPIMMVFSVLVGLFLAMRTEVHAYEAVHRALALIALSSAVPAFIGIPDIRFAARAGAASRGVVFGSDQAFKDTAATQSVVFSAEGTLTAGKQQVIRTHSLRLDSDTMLKIAAHAMAYAHGPEAEAVLDAYDGEIQFELIDDFKEIPNCGVDVVFNGIPVTVGAQAMMSDVQGFVHENVHVDQQMLFMSIGHQYAGYLVLADPIRKSAGTLASDMASFAVENIEFVTSYSEETAKVISERSGIKKYAASCGSDARLNYVEQVRESTTGKVTYMYNEQTAAECHSDADVDVSIGGKPTDLLSGKCDVVVPGGRPLAFTSGVAAANLANKMSNFAVYFVFGTKLILIMLAALGIIPVWFAVTLECIASLFTKVFASSAFHEQPAGIMGRLIQNKA